ncbi:hypothetical protein GALMADRAFT_148583 [Galerina marginata CBS 339.88]|uniref:Uncharacterized protein n=1 Tax=Galerina marginata (strain CBS 339.88) TaxID=685588 RepID=A0A067SFQ2_GALM3|nr:hypothetical protein GALMADRAFT_148583 [Galerina marginata CBS 339.88]
MIVSRSASSQWPLAINDEKMSESLQDMLAKVPDRIWAQIPKNIPRGSDFYNNWGLTLLDEETKFDENLTRLEEEAKQAREAAAKQREKEDEKELRRLRRNPANRDRCVTGQSKLLVDGLIVNDTATTPRTFHPKPKPHEVTHTSYGMPTVSNDVTIPKRISEPTSNPGATVQARMIDNLAYDITFTHTSDGMPTVSNDVTIPERISEPTSNPGATVHARMIDNLASDITCGRTDAANARLEELNDLLQLRSQQVETLKSEKLFLKGVVNTARSQVTELADEVDKMTFKWGTASSALGLSSKNLDAVQHELATAAKKRERDEKTIDVLQQEIIKLREESNVTIKTQKIQIEALLERHRYRGSPLSDHNHELTERDGLHAERPSQIEAISISKSLVETLDANIGLWFYSIKEALGEIEAGNIDKSRAVLVQVFDDMKKRRQSLEEIVDAL